VIERFTGGAARPAAAPDAAAGAPGNGAATAAENAKSN